MEYIKLKDEELKGTKISLLEKLIRQVRIMQIATFCMAIDCILLTWMVLK